MEEMVMTVTRPIHVYLEHWVVNFWELIENMC
jgi:hypothetical protein